MRRRKFGRRLATFSAALAALVLIVGSPAFAAYAEDPGYFWGSSGSNDYFSYNTISEIDTYTSSPLGYEAYVDVDLEVGSASVISATNCTLSMWDTLDKIDSNEWDSPHSSVNCMSAINTRGVYSAYQSAVWDTSATAAESHICMYLYYNHSSTYTHAYCETGKWANAA